MLDQAELQDALRHLPYFAAAKVLQYNAATGRTEWVATGQLTNLSLSGWERVGSLVVPTNVTAGDVTAGRIFLPDQTVPSPGPGLVNLYTNSAIGLLLRGDSSAGVNIRIQQAGVSALIQAMRSGGSIASPSAVLNNDIILELAARGFYDTSNQSGDQANLSLLAAENWSGTARGTYAIVRLTNPTTTTQNDRHYFLYGGFITPGYIGAGYATGSPPTSPVAGIFDASVGYRIAGAAASGNVLRGNGTNFVSSALGFSDLSGSITTAQIPDRTRTVSIPIGGATPGGSGVATTADIALRGTNTRYRAWAFDKDTAEAITLEFVVPQDYVSGASFSLGWTNLGAGSGNVRWQLIGSGRVTTNDLNSGIEFNTTDIIGAPAQDILTVSTHSVAPSVAAGEVMLIQVVRDAATGTDTLANDAGLVSLAFVYTADS